MLSLQPNQFTSDAQSLKLNLGCMQNQEAIKIQEIIKLHLYPSILQKEYGFTSNNFLKNLSADQITGQCDRILLSYCNCD